MKNSDLIKFLKHRAKHDTPKVFMFRIIRLAIIFLYRLQMNRYFRYMRKYYSCWHVFEIQGNKMELDTTASGISRDLIYNGKREPYANAKWISMLNADDVVVDIGANIGYYALQEARVAKKVYAFEPGNHSFAELMGNIILNDIKNITPAQVAIGDRVGTADFYKTQDSNLCTLYPTREFSQKYKVCLFTLDSIMAGKEYPTAVRMDVEGYEYEIINGMTGLLEQQQPMKLFIELHLDILGPDKVRELASTLKSYGFRIVTASIEPHPAVMKYKLGRKLTGYCDRQIGAPQGYFDITFNELRTEEKYTNGQIEWLEIILER